MGFTRPPESAEPCDRDARWWRRPRRATRNGQPDHSTLCREAAVIRIDWDRFALAVSSVAIMTVLLAGRPSFPPNATPASAATAPTSSARDGRVPPPPQGRSSVPQLVEQSTLSLRPDQMPLGISVSGASVGAAVEITGLPSGSMLSSGRRLGPDSWRLPAADAAGAVIELPAGLSGRIDLVIDLRLADDILADRRLVRREVDRQPDGSDPHPMRRAEDRAVARSAASGDMAASRRPDPNPIADLASGPQAVFPIRHLGAAEISALCERGEKLLAMGDVSAARLLLLRAAQAGNARAMLALGATYDPVALAQFGIDGNTADIATARAFYETAGKLGSPGAPQRLRMLAHRDQ